MKQLTPEQAHLMGHYSPPKPELTISPNDDQSVTINVNKETHRIKFEGESEHEVTVRIEPKEEA